MSLIGLRRAARVCLIVMAVAAFAAFLTPWLTRPNGDVIFGVDIGNLAYGLREYPVTQLFTEVAILPAFLAVLLAPGVAVRSRWGRFVAVVPAVLAAALTGFAAYGFLAEIEDYWEPQRVTNYQLFAATTAAVAVLVLGLAVVLAVGHLRAGLRRFYPVAVALLLIGAAAFHLYAIVTITSLASVDVEVSVLAWAPLPAYLLAALSAAVAGYADANATGDADVRAGGVGGAASVGRPTL
ncbi:hypothetical protein [Plantactinospora sp. GCM10030261]|uniref:hypothetical protein n=1 Tax=Plantactinospora sp. GCM10030261 TaxID=3273420 RepID=UPI0036093F5A